MVVFFGNDLFITNPQILLVRHVFKTALGKAFNGIVQIMLALYDAASLEMM